MTDIKFEIIRTEIVTIGTAWKYMEMVPDAPKWSMHKKTSLILDRSRYLMNTDDYLNEVQAWCQATGNGRRTSYDTFHFSKPAKMTAFLLRWNNG